MHGSKTAGVPVVQVTLVKTGKPYVMFGDGTLASCKPISEADLARFMADCVQDRSKVNQVLPIGGLIPPCLSGFSPPTSMQAPPLQHVQQAFKRV